MPRHRRRRAGRCGEGALHPHHRGGALHRAAIGQIDVLIRDSTLTFTRGVQLGLNEVAVNFYAGQGFLVKKSLGVSKAADLAGATIYMLTGATLELNIADFARATGAKIDSLLFDKVEPFNNSVLQNNFLFVISIFNFFIIVIFLFIKNNAMFIFYSNKIFY